MWVEQFRWTEAHGWSPRVPEAAAGRAAQLAFVFGSPAVLRTGQDRLAEISRRFPGVELFGCSTAGEILGTEVTDDSLVVTVVGFDHTRVRGTHVSIARADDSLAAGRRLAEALPREGLVHVLVLSDGLKVNGSELVQGLVAHLPPRVTVTGGLSGDGDRFHETLVVREGVPVPNAVTAMGLYGDRLRVGYASLGGWDPFGPERLITRSSKNVLFELDGKSALALYKTYLGEDAAGLPATGLLYPLALRGGDGGAAGVRTILAVDEERQSMTFAGDVPEGAYARFMKANFDRLIDGAIGAARTSRQAGGASRAGLALLISCVGRKMVLKQRIEEEVEGVREVMGPETPLAGFYSYGEISPFTPSARCELHNQTMTITTLTET
jgi:hypothetical protein